MRERDIERVVTYQESLVKTKCQYINKENKACTDSSIAVVVERNKKRGGGWKQQDVFSIIVCLEYGYSVVLGSVQFGSCCSLLVKTCQGKGKE